MVQKSQNLNTALCKLLPLWMFFWPEEETVTLIFSLLSYSLLDGRGKRRKRQIFVWVREGVLGFVLLKLLQSE